MLTQLLPTPTKVGAVYSAQYLNSYGAQNWEQFATQNYFDSKGFFISMMFSFPLLLMAILILVSSSSSHSMQLK